MTWNDLAFWDSQEWQTIQERLDDLDKRSIKYNPKRENLFAALDATPFDGVKVVILGQDPYPTAEHATGLAFSIPRTTKTFPPTLVNIFKEYCEDLHHPFPRTGDLTPWSSQGVFLWNVVPTCYVGKPASHSAWTEWSVLTSEIIQRLQEKPTCFVLLGGLSRDFRQFIDEGRNAVFSYSHPSPLGARKTASPFLGSRLFSTINDRLIQQGEAVIDWRLP